jgi:hypothetical protein
MRLDNFFAQPNANPIVNKPFWVSTGVFTHKYRRVTALNSMHVSELERERKQPPPTESKNADFFLLNSPDVVSPVFLLFY